MFAADSLCVRHLNSRASPSLELRCRTATGDMVELLVALADSAAVCAQASELEGLSLPQIQMPGSNGRFGAFQLVCGNHRSTG